MLELLLIWWGFWMIVEGVSMYHRWPIYVRMYNRKSRFPLWLMVVLFLPVSPGFKIWEVFKPLFVLPHYRVQIEIFRYDGRNAKVASDVLKVSDGEEIATKLIEGDNTICSLYYQVVTIHEEGVLDAKPKTPAD
jgi:hypothetical protein